MQVLKNNTISACISSTFVISVDYAIFQQLGLERELIKVQGNLEAEMNMRNQANTAKADMECKLLLSDSAYKEVDVQKRRASRFCCRASGLSPKTFLCPLGEINSIYRTCENFFRLVKMTPLLVHPGYRKIEFLCTLIFLAVSMESY